MPHRIIRTIHGTLGDILVIFGIYMIGLGLSWFALPTSSRESGVQWINESVLPVNGMTSGHVAWWWIVGGTLTLVGGLFSRKSLLERMGVAAGIFFPFVVAGLFFGGWVDGASRTGIVSAWSYFVPSAVILWSALRGSDDPKEIRVVTGQMDQVD